MKKAVKSDELTKYYEESQGLERDYIGEVMRSRGTAWTVAKVASGTALLAVMGLAALAPLRKEVPYVVTVTGDGVTNVVRQMADNTTTYGENVDKHFLNEYVLRRESYDYNTLEYDYRTTALLSEPAVQDQYFALYSGPDSKEKKLMNTVRTLVTIKSITPNQQTGTAVVRFKTEDHHNDGTVSGASDWIATIAYHYVKADIAEKDLRTNPLGFQVSSYRVDPETGGGQ
jgi:type IV secretion system protein VirB8